LPEARLGRLGLFVEPLGRRAFVAVVLRRIRQPLPLSPLSHGVVVAMDPRLCVSFWSGTLTIAGSARRTSLFLVHVSHLSQDRNRTAR
jgi:hypothetical protein